MAATFLTIPEVAELLRIGERTAYTLAREGRLGGSVKVGNQWRIERRAFERWVRHGGQGEAPATRRGARPPSRGSR